MSKETALQIAMRIMHRYANSLFDEHTQRGRQFMQEMTECLEQERKQIIDAYEYGYVDGDIDNGNSGEDYYIQEYKADNE
jgi:predicted transcriptional regulator